MNDMQLFIPRLETFFFLFFFSFFFFLHTASQYPRILLTVESLRFLKKKSKRNTLIYSFLLKKEILLDNFNEQSIKIIQSCQLS